MNQEINCECCPIYNEHLNEIMDLIELTKNDDSKAFEIIIKEYSSFIHTIGNRLFFPGGNYEDIEQEGLIGLFEAVTKFDPSINRSFEKFASLCIRNSILASLKKANQKKQNTLNKSTFLQDITMENGEFKLLIDESFESSVVLKTVLENLINDSAKSLSAIEYKILVAKIAGYSTEEIVSMFHITRKQVENAIFRARNKIKDILETL